jgi:rSAM/selenodomain-associated transferase 1
MSDTALVIMARYPQKGMVKTRLARSIGDERTLQLYQAFLIDLAHRFAGSEFNVHWAYTPAQADFKRYLAELVPDVSQQWQCFPQEGEDFGARLHHAFRMTCPQPFRQTVLIASDSPHVSQAIIHQAQQALDEADVVLGPAEDGGYYLIAMREPHDVFTDIPMSTEVVLEMTLAKARGQGLTTRLLAPLFDVDEVTELVRLAALLQQEQALAPATAIFLEQIMEKIA